ncbi:MAG: type 4a pilus biogenesis protein PilO [Thermodesulfobacteriota bacterium]
MAIDIKNLIKYDALLKLPLSKKILVVAGVNIVIAALFYQLLLKPQTIEIASFTIGLADLTAKVEENRRIAADIPRFQKEKADLEEQLRKSLAQLPNEKEIPNLIDSISESAKKSGLKVVLFQPGQETSRGFYADIPVDMSVEGTFESLYNFCVKISELPRIVNIQNINTGLASGGAILSNPIVTARFVTMTFRFVSPDEATATAAEAAKKRR